LTQFIIQVLKTVTKIILRYHYHSYNAENNDTLQKELAKKFKKKILSEILKEIKFNAIVHVI
jgi:hypothetical protein